MIIIEDKNSNHFRKEERGSRNTIFALLEKEKYDKIKTKRSRLLQKTR